ncbi:uncharacterized protein LOC105204489 [Solenopsis invicta]|uniref:uncharacterized protein LOC105204489 n=1 Tax=Solenopsis invicta TaxID=13686 RepID=UPI00193E7896|nr:uncharacterized protein LOC105204489 [Solenopsis invicta]
MLLILSYANINNVWVIQVLIRLYMFLVLGYVYSYIEQNCFIQVYYIFRRNKEAGTKAKRQAKATSAQIDYMVDYFVQHPHVATGKFQSLHGNTDLRGSWEQLVTQLNSIGKNGKTKDVKSWESTWRDNKTAVSQKIAKIRANRSVTGNVGGAPDKLTEREKKILGLMGLDYVEGVQCPDSFPEEQAEAMNLLTAGDDEILNIIPEPLTIRDNINDVIMEHDVNCIVLDATGEPLGEGSTLNIIQTDSQIKNVETAKQPHHCETTESLSGFPINEDIPQSLITVTQGSSKKRRAPQNTRRNTERLGTQLQNAREDFATLAERQISCMEVRSI